jgi:hypothetical protein
LWFRSSISGTNGRQNKKEKEHHSSAQRTFPLTSAAHFRIKTWIFKTPEVCRHKNFWLQKNFFDGYLNLDYAVTGLQLQDHQDRWSYAVKCCQRFRFTKMMRRFGEINAEASLALDC